MSRRVLSVTAGALLALGLPAAAQAATITVDPGAPAGCDAANACKTVADALGKAAAGDTVTVNDGSYNEGPLTIADDRVTLRATNPGKATIVGQGTTGDPVLSIGDGTGTGRESQLDGLLLATGQATGSILSVEAPGVKVARTAVLRSGATGNVPAIDVDDSGAGFTGGVTTFTASSVLQFPQFAQAPATPAPAVQGGDRSSLTLEDSLVLSGPQAGPALALSGSDQPAAGPVPNRIVRGSYTAGNGAADAVTLTSASDSATAKALEVDAAALLPGGQGVGLRVQSLAAQLGRATAGNLSAVLHHVTIAGGARPFVAAAGAAGAGNVTITADRSILHGAGASTVTNVPATTVPVFGTVLVPANQATLTETQSDTTDKTTDTAAAKTTVTGGQTNTDAAIFANPGKADAHILPTAPVIGKGGAPVAGQSATDFEGEPRGDVTDLGADEFTDLPPVARLAVDRTAIKAGEAVTFDLSASMDQGIGGGITRYVLDAGDGTPAADGTAKTVTHTYTVPGTYTATAAVADGPGQVAIATATITVADAGTPPTVAITGPASGASLKLFKTKVTRKTLKPAKKGGPKRRRTTTTRTLNKITLSGTAADPSGLRSVELSLRRVSTTGKLLKAKTVKVTKLRQAGGSCTFLDAGKRTYVGRACSNPLFFTVATKPDGTWAYTLKGKGYRAGSYTLSARATDAAGNVSAPVTSSFKLTQ